MAPKINRKKAHNAIALVAHMRYMYLINQGDTEMNAYEAAIEAHNEAQTIFAAARAKFYAIPGIATKADFAEFAAAQSAMKVADRAFDAAFNAEAERLDALEAEAAANAVTGENTDQIEMF